jgi:hypothetical protein
MAELRRYCTARDRGETIHEDVDVFLFQRRERPADGGAIHRT